MAYTNIWVIPKQGNMGGGKLYDRHGNLKYFATVDALTDETRTAKDVESSVKSHSRGAFMRDPSKSTISAHSRYVSVGLRQTKGAPPGYTVTLVSGSEKRQFQWTGTMSGLVAWLKTTAKVAIDLFGPTGAPYDTIPAVSEG